MESGKTRHILSVCDLNDDEIKGILSLAEDLKQQQKAGHEHPLLKGKSLAMIFQKPSNRTRISFEVGMYQLGGHALNIRPSEIKMKEREPIPDIARVLCRYVDAVMLRVLRHEDLLEFAEHSSVPVINGLSDLCHPCQAISDMFTVLEHKGRLEGLRICYVGDGNNVCNSLISVCKMLGVEFVVSCPEKYAPMGEDGKAVAELEPDPVQAVANADVVYTDVWTSMGQEEESSSRKRDFQHYRVTEQLLKRASSDVIFMHCLPAKRGEEVDDAVVESKHSVIFDQAENRLHVQKAILVELLNNLQFGK